jgi:hypothetical protein
MLTLQEKDSTSRKCLRFKKMFALQENACASRKGLHPKKMFALQENVCASRKCWRFKKMFALPENVHPSGKGLRYQNLCFDRTQHFAQCQVFKKLIAQNYNELGTHENDYCNEHMS